MSAADSLATTVVQIQRRQSALCEAVNAALSKFDYNPGHSDLDDEQPIHVPMTLGDYRKLRRLAR